MRRDELYDSSSDAGSGSHVDAQDDAEVRAKLNERLAGLLGLDLAAPAPAAPTLEQQKDDDDHKQDEEFEFRLFSTSSKTTVPAKVVLAASDDEDAPQGEGGFTVPVRPTSYYVAAQPTPEQLERYRWAATSGQDILLGARKRAWGSERPWRVVRLKVPKKSLAGLHLPPAAAAQVTLGHASEDDEQQTAVKRKRPGKKRRIASRIKAKAEKEKHEAEEKNKMSKEEHLKGKKKRLNREKKLKRRAKEKEKKLATQAEGGVQPVSEAGASESDDGSAA